MPLAGNITVSAGVTVLDVIPVAVTYLGSPFLLATPIYQYANLSLPFSPNDPGLQAVIGNTNPLVARTLAARFFNLMNEYSQPLFFGNGANVKPVNQPIIFEPPLRMCLSGVPELWLVVSDSDPNYTGCLPIMSTDSGNSWQMLKDINGNNVISGNATQGFVISGGWAQHADVDADDPLFINLTESNGSISSILPSDQNNFRYPCFVATGALVTSAPSVYAGASGQAGYSFDAGGAPSLTTSYRTPAGCPLTLMAALSRGGTMAVWSLTGGDAGAVQVINHGIGTQWCANCDASPYIIHGLVVGSPTCPGGICVQADAGNLVSGAPPFLNEFFESVSVGILTPSTVAAVMHQTGTGSHGATFNVTLDEANLSGSWNNWVTGSTEVTIVKLLPNGGGVPLYVAFVIGANWNTVFSGVGAKYQGWTVVQADLGGSGLACALVFTGSTTIFSASGYELMEYQAVNSISGNLFVMPAASGFGGPLRRAVFSMPTPGIGPAHGNLSPFAWLDDRLSKSPNGIMKIPLDQAWIGQELRFKFAPIPILSLDPDDYASYSYFPTGLAELQFSPSPAYVQNPTLALSQTNATTIQMAQVTEAFATNTIKYNGRTFTIPDPGPGNTQVYYVTILDENQVGDYGTAVNLQAFCDPTQARIGQPGYVYIGAIVTQHTGFASDYVFSGGWPPPVQDYVNGT